jgi:DNA helicase-2/ATP-dependent DNA helicase PcrA
MSAPPYTLDNLVATDEQAAIINYALEHNSHLLINALAGAAKTSTLRFLAKYMSLEPTLSLAFNKRIVETMAKVLPGHVKPSTANSIGHRVWGSAIGRRLTVSQPAHKKTYDIVKDQINKIKDRGERMDAYDLFSDITGTIRTAKSEGYVPPSAPSGRSLVTPDEFFGGLEEAPDGWFIDLVNRCLLEGITQAYKGLIDFDDQPYMSTLFGGSFPQFKRVMADEVQDFSPINHAMLDRLVGPSTRLLAVGDPNQSIYAFRGAQTNSMALLKERFNMNEMPLSVSFRCPRAVVRNAWKRAPHMRWPDWAEEGTVQFLPAWNVDTIEDGAAVICRANAPLLRLAMILLRHMRGVNLVGTDLGPQLVRALKKLGDPAMEQQDVLAAIDHWEREKLAKSRNPAATVDRAQCLRVFARFGPTLNHAIGLAEHIFSTKGPIQLLSGHKAKGMEWDITYHLDPHRVPTPYAKSGEALEQERNVKYVIETRARKALYFIKLDGFVGEADTEERHGQL